MAVVDAVNNCLTKSGAERISVPSAALNPRISCFSNGNSYEVFPVASSLIELIIPNESVVTAVNDDDDPPDTAEGSIVPRPYGVSSISHVDASLLALDETSDLLRDNFNSEPNW